jgi:hypothetical protein
LLDAQSQWSFIEAHIRFHKRQSERRPRANGTQPDSLGATVDAESAPSSFDGCMTRLYGFTLPPDGWMRADDCWQWNTRGDRVVGLW